MHLAPPVANFRVLFHASRRWSPFSPFLQTLEACFAKISRPWSPVSANLQTLEPGSPDIGDNALFLSPSAWLGWLFSWQGLSVTSCVLSRKCRVLVPFFPATVSGGGGGKIKRPRVFAGRRGRGRGGQTGGCPCRHLRGGAAGAAAGAVPPDLRRMRASWTIIMTWLADQ